MRRQHSKTKTSLPPVRSAPDCDTPHAVTDSLERAIEGATRTVASPDWLLAQLLKGKLKEKGVRLSASEKDRLREAAAELIRTGDPNVLSKVIRRKRNISIAIESRDIERIGQTVSEVTGTAVTKVIRKLARTVEPELREWADGVIQWAAEMEEGFANRMTAVWGDAFQLYARFRRLAEHLGELVMARCRESKPVGKTSLVTALVRLHVRACAVAGEIETLMRAGYADGAAARWRTLHEVAVTASFLVEHGEDMAARYLAHFACEQLKAARGYQEHCHVLGYRPLAVKLMQELEADVTALRAKYGDDFRHEYGWAAYAFNRQRVTFSDIESSVKMPFMRPFYRLASEQIHASARGAVLRGGLIEQNRDEPLLLVGPSNYGFADPAMNSARSLLLATVSLGQVDPTADTNIMGMVLAKWLESLTASFVKAQREIEKRDRHLDERRKKR